jgi:enamine deaminase RidA (YjgF/YER057c/UK114 family)
VDCAIKLKYENEMEGPEMKITYINPSQLATPRGYSQAVSISGDYSTIYIGGQNAIDGQGNLVGKNSLKEQTRQVLDNIEAILNSVGGNFSNIVKLDINLLQGQNPQEGFTAFQQKLGTIQSFPAVSVRFVSGLGRPEWLVEIDGVAVVNTSRA